MQKILIKSAAMLYLGILCFLPFQWYKISPYGEIFPALDLIIIYYLSTHYRVKYWHLFLVGVMVDQLYQVPLGTSSLALMAANWGLYMASNWLLLRDYFINLAVFCGYALFVIGARYLLVTISSTHHIEGLSIFFYFLTTIFAYPIILPIIIKPINLLNYNAGQKLS